MSPFETSPESFDLAGVSVMIGIPVNRDFPWQTTNSLLEVQSMLINRGVPHQIQLVVGGSIVCSARNKVAHAFLKTEMNRLFMIDSDQEFEAKDFLRLLCMSTKLEAVGAVYPAKTDHGGVMKFLFKAEPGEVTAVHGCLPIIGMGLGFTVVHRDIIERLAAKAPKLIFPDSPEPVAQVFRCDSLDGYFRGEDNAFFADVRELGITPYFDPALSIGHVGSKTYKADIREAITKIPTGVSA